MRLGLSPLLCAALLAQAGGSLPAHAQNVDTSRRRPLFIETQAYKALAIIARAAKANIVVPQTLNTPVQLSLRGDVPLEEAVRLVAAQANAAYRRVGNTFIVAPIESMRKVMEQNGVSETVPVTNLAPPALDAVATQISTAVPYVTARPAGRSIELVGAPEDIDRAKAILRDLDVPSTAGPNETATISLTYAEPSELLTVLNNTFGRPIAQVVGHSLFLSGPQGDVQRAVEIIRSLDRGKEANIRYTVYSVKYSSAFALATTLRMAIQNITVVPGPEPFRIPRTTLNLSTGSTIGSSSSGGGINTGGGSGNGGGGNGGNNGGTDQTQQQALPGQAGTNGIGGRTRTLIIGGTDDVVKGALDLLTKIDVPTPQIALDVKVVSTSPSTTQQLGIQWSPSTATSIFERPGAAATDINGQPFVRNSFTFGNWARTPFSAVTATLNAFFQRTDVRILAKPTITALDNEEGIIFVGETRRVFASTAPTVGGGNNLVVLNTIVEIPVGIILQMTPRLTEDDLIQLRVHPIYSTATDVNATTGLFTSQNREAETTVRVKSGETIVIGGLLQDEDTKTLQKVPILGDIPILGQFFRNHTHTHNRQEVLVFVTPHLIKE